MIKFIKGASRSKDYPSSKYEIVFVGRSNVGKSSLINALFGKVAYVGKTPGKTRIINFFDVDNRYTVADVPGYGFANRSQNELIEFGEMMEDYFNNRKCLKICVLIIDIRRIPNNDDIEMIDFLKNKSIKCLVVANKLDKLSYSNSLKSIDTISKALGLPKDKVLTVSCTNKTNIDKLKELLNI